MLSFLKKLFTAKQSAPEVIEAPYKIEAPTLSVDGDVITVNRTAAAATEVIQSSWPFPDSSAAPARKSNTRRKPATAITAKGAVPVEIPEATAKPPRRPRKPRAPKV